MKKWILRILVAMLSLAVVMGMAYIERGYFVVGIEVILPPIVTALLTA